MAYWNPSTCQREDLPVHHALLRKLSGGLSTGHLPNSLASLLKANGYNHIETPRVTEILIKFHKLQLSPNARLNHDTKVMNQI
jgi:hypothetical protein